MNDAAYLASAVQDRNEWLSRRGALAKDFLARLVELAADDFAFQRHVRGVSEEGSLSEAFDNADRWLESLCEEARDAVSAALDSR